MAIIEARMQQKRGKLAKLDKDQLLPGEFAIPEDSDSIFVCISAGNVMEIPSKQAMQTLLDTLSKVVDKGEQIVEDFKTLEVEKAAINDNEESTVTTFSSAKIMQLIDAINEFAIALVEELPTEDIDTHTIYFLPKEQADNDVYDEYIYINGAWEHIGSTQIDLSGYYTGDQVEAIKSELQGEIDELNSNLLWKAAPNWSTAYANAKSEFLFVFRGINPSSNLTICYTINVPKSVISDEKCFFVNGSALNTDNCAYVQLALTKTNMTDTIMRLNNVSYNDVVITTYYR